MTLQSSIAWIDFDDQDRRKMVEVLSLFRLRDTRDDDLKPIGENDTSTGDYSSILREALL